MCVCVCVCACVHVCRHACGVQGIQYYAYKLYIVFEVLCTHFHWSCKVQCAHLLGWKFIRCCRNNRHYYFSFCTVGNIYYWFAIFAQSHKIVHPCGILATVKSCQSVYGCHSPALSAWCTSPEMWKHLPLHLFRGAFSKCHKCGLTQNIHWGEVAHILPDCHWCELRVSSELYAETKIYIIIIYICCVRKGF